MLFNSRKEKMNNSQIKIENSLYEPDLTDTFPQNERDSTISKLFDYTTNMNSEETGLEEDYESINEQNNHNNNNNNNEVINEYDENFNNNNHTENDPEEYHCNESEVDIDHASELNNQNNDYPIDNNFPNQNEDHNDIELIEADQNGGSINGDYQQENFNGDYQQENYSGEPELIDQNEANYNGDYMNGDITNDGMHNGMIDDSKNGDYTMNESKFDPYTGNLEFVTSKVGHPMLVVDGHTFHKHSTNPKSGRVNWRCARRRVKDIRCSSSCYTQDGISSVPKPHDPNCFPLRNIGSSPSKTYKREIINKNECQASTPRFINTKADSYTTSFNRKAMGVKNASYQGEMGNDASNLNGDQFNDHEFGQYSANVDGNNHGNNEEYVSEYNGSEEYIPYNPEEHGVATDEENFLIEQLGPDMYNIDDYSKSPESFAQLISDLNKMKQREKIYSNRVNLGLAGLLIES